MLLSEAIKASDHSYSAKDVAGHELPDWYEIGNLLVESGGIEVVDPCCHASVRVQTPNGVYAAEARLIDFGGNLRVSRLRARLETVAAPSRSAKSGTVPVELACVLVADMQALYAGLTSQEIEESYGLMCRFAGCPGSMCQLRFESKTIQFAICSSGWGDGTYPVYGLNSDGQTIGLEVVFIVDGAIRS